MYTVLWMQLRRLGKHLCTWMHYHDIFLPIPKLSDATYPSCSYSGWKFFYLRVLLGMMQFIA